LKIDTQLLENHQIKVIVEATPEEYESVRQKAIRELTKKVKIPGFRPGKAPLAIALKHLDPKLVAEETLEMFIEQYYPKILEEKNIDPYGAGTLEHISTSEPPTMEFVIPLRPHVELGDYRSIRIPYNFEPLDESEVDKALENLRESYAMIEPVERPVQSKDVVYIDILGTVNAELDQPAETIANFSNYPIEVVEDKDRSEHEWPFPGFSAYLIGKSVNDVVEIDYTFPETYNVENLKGKTAHFTVTIKNIKQRNLPELNDEFAQSLGEFANLDELKQSIRNSLEKAKLEEYHEDYDDQILNEIFNRSTILYPPQMVDKEQENVIEQLEQRLKRSNMDLDLYLKTRSLTREEFEKEARQVAEERIKRTLVVFEIAEAEKIEIDKNQLQAETMQAFNEMVNYVPPAKRTKEGDKQIISGLIEDLSVDILMRNTLEKIRRIAKGEEEAQLPTEENIPENSELENSEQKLMETKEEVRISETSEMDKSEPEQAGVENTTVESDNS